MKSRGIQRPCGTDLLDHGFKNVYALKGGFDAWYKAGYPLEPKF